MKGNLTPVLAVAALAAFALTATPAFAGGGWSRSGGGVGPYGRTWSSSGSGHCSGGSCTSNQAFVGPNGGVTSRSGATSCYGGTCNHSATVTGPNGGTRTRNSTWTRY
jgi:hypothetical protein